jgi:beta-glucosidase
MDRTKTLRPFFIPIFFGAVFLTAGTISAGPMPAAKAADKSRGPQKSTEVSDREIMNSEVSLNAATQGMVLLENKDHALPLEKKGKIALFGSGAYYTISGGTGSGDVNERRTVNVKEGFLNAGYTVTSTAWIDAYGAAWEEGYKASKQARNFMLDDTEVTSADIGKSKAAGADTVVYVVARVSGEGSDREIARGNYYLSDQEYANIKKCAESFSKCIVVLNVGGVIDTRFYHEIDGIDAMLLMSQAGQRGGDAVVKVLNGDVTPSGKLAATWAADYKDYPASAVIAGHDGDALQENYTEGIYVGYRYFDTFNVTPAYAFGYGLSYTDFDIAVTGVTADVSTITVSAKVTNTGKKYSGREVVEVYFSAPDGKLEKPYQELAAFGKTDELKPGQSQLLTITFRTTELSSYDEKSASYLMDAGNYVIRVGNSSRNTTVAAVLKLNESVVTEALSNQMVADKPIEELHKRNTKPYTYEGEEKEIAAARVIPLNSRGFKSVSNTSEYDSGAVNVYVSATTETKYLHADGNVTIGSYSGKKTSYKENVIRFTDKKGNLIDYSGYTMKDVYDGTITMEQFVSAFSLEELANIVVGSYGSGSAAIFSEYNNGTFVGAQAKRVNGAAGESYNIDNKYIPGVVMADGPAGLRISQNYQVTENGNPVEYHQYCTAFPVGTLLAQTWDPDVVTKVTAAIGREMEEYGVSIWLAPGMNIQRDPACGRNYEYYSEDPYLTGIMGATATAGIQSIPGIGVTIKHFACNNQETNRNKVNNTIGERTLREIYLKGFEMAVKQGQPVAIMTSYNLNQGVPAADDYDLCTDIARGEWGFTGFIMTDWGGGQSTPAYSMHAGNDIVMPGGDPNVILSGFTDMVPPTFLKTGVPYVKLIERTNSSGTFQKEIYSWGEFTPAAEGTVKVSTTVAADVSVDQSRIDKIIETCGKCVTVTPNADGTKTVTYTGTASAKKKDIGISLGDVQKSAIHILNAVMASNNFAAQFNNVKAESYTEAHKNLLSNYLSVSKKNSK